MNSYAFAIHDLNNKLMTLYGLLRMYKQGTPPSIEKTDAIIERINEIMKSLYTDYRPELNVKRSLESMTQDDLQSFLDLTKRKFAKIYDELTINIQIPEVKWENNYFIQIDRILLSQAIENAVENSRNAKASEILINLYLLASNVVIEIRDNGEGFKNQDRFERLIPQATGITIIKENMNFMGGETNYLYDHTPGVTLRLIFPIKMVAS